ncbi:MAG: DUF4838 domain-containing protein [Armatimonadota bacterium]
MPTSPLTIYCLDDDAPVRLAAKELARCLRAMTGTRVAVRPAKRFSTKRGGIYVGLPGHARRELGATACLPDDWDDALLVRSYGASLLLTGANPRSILFSAYRWLEALGARWIRPGKDGEHLPAIDMPALTGWDLTEQPAQRHRGIVIEGTNFIEQVLELVDWMPKLRMNAYMLQFRVCAYFWRRWYERNMRAIKNPHLLSMEECAALDNRVIEAVKDRGLLFHQVGHGWTCEAVGNHGSGWEKEAQSAPAEIRPLLAEVNGVRDWADGIPINTELCYSNPEARRRFVAEVINYAQAHPNVDVLHTWASDGLNNCCECADCAKMSPSDWYITLLNEISPRLAQEAPHMRIVALCYSNTMWPPEQVAPSGLGKNLIFMFAPIARCYAHTILDKRCIEKPVLTPFTRNQVARPRSNADYAAMLRAWQRYLPAGTDAFVFDYHFWWALPKDLLGTNYLYMLHDDVQQYRKAGLNGILNCQLQRTTMPTGLPQIAMAEYLWNPELTPEEVKDHYFPAAFGPASHLAQEFLDAFAQATGACGHGNKWWLGMSRYKARTVRRVLRQHVPHLRQAFKETKNPVWKRSWELLLYYVRYQQLLWTAIIARTNNRPEAVDLIHRTIDYLWRTEPKFYHWVDTHFFVRILRDELLADWAEEDAKKLAPVS